MNESEASPLISIAMCTYNGERFLAEQLDSILAQSYRNLEIVIVDDCSSDGTQALLDDYQRRDARIRLIKNDKNLGFVRNFSKALGACSGDYIALSDQDDIWFPRKLEHLYRDIGDNWLIYSKVAVIDAQGRRLDSSFPAVERLQGDCALSLVLNNCVTGHACLMRTELLAMALPLLDQVPYHDQFLAIAAASLGKLKAGDEVLSLYRIHGGNAVVGNKQRRRDAKHIVAANKRHGSIGLAELLINSGWFEGEPLDLLRQFRDLYRRSDVVFFNWQLWRFLHREGRPFMRLFTAPGKVINKTCRGSWFFILLPFS